MPVRVHLSSLTIEQGECVQYQLMSILDILLKGKWLGDYQKRNRIGRCAYLSESIRLALSQKTINSRAMTLLRGDYLQAVQSSSTEGS
jgi:hypothetical protein